MSKFTPLKVTAQNQVASAPDVAGIRCFEDHQCTRNRQKNKDHVLPTTAETGALNSFHDKSTRDGQSEDTKSQTLPDPLQMTQLEIKPVVSSMMRQIRELREIDQFSPETASTKIENIEGASRRLWAFLDGLEQLTSCEGPTVPGGRGGIVTPSIINLRVPSERPSKPLPKENKPPSIFRRRPA